MAKRVTSAYMTPETAIAGWVWLFIQLLFLPSGLSLLNGLLPKALSQTELNFVFYLVNFLAVCIIFCEFLGNSIRHALRHPAYCLQAVVLGLCAFYALTAVVTRVLHYIDPKFTNINDSTIISLAKNGRFLMVIGTVVLTPPAEECFYRGLVFRQIFPRSRWAAYVLSMLVFAAIHVVGYIGKFSVARLVMCFVQYLPAGLCLAWSYTKADTIVAPILIHAIINAESMHLIR